MRHIADHVFPEVVEFPFKPAAYYYRDTEYHKRVGLSSEPGWRVDALQGVYRWYEWDHPTIEVCKTEAEAVQVVRRASWDSATPEEHVRFALAHPEEARRLLDLYGEPEQ